MVGSRTALIALALTAGTITNPGANGAGTNTAASAKAIDVVTVRGPEPMIVSVDWLAQHYRDANVVLLQVGAREEYDKEHIPGARFIELKDISTPHEMNNKASLMLEFPKPEELRASFARLGISDNSHVVVYYGSDWVTPTTRVVHTLNYIGLGDQTSLLNGGMGAWKKAGRPVTADAPVVKQGRLSARATRDVTVTADWVREHLHSKGIQIVDGRSRNFYDGKGQGGVRQGHIAGAVSLSFEEIAGDDMMIYDKATLEKKFAAAGIAPGDTIIAYCHIGQQATAVVFASRLLGRTVKLYDGSFTEWETLPAAEYPVETSSAKSGGQ
jgi:thiosulfate/3-mercaptopyruvate sulfurtransferase